MVVEKIQNSPEEYLHSKVYTIEEGEVGMEAIHVSHALEAVKQARQEGFQVGLDSAAMTARITAEKTIKDQIILIIDDCEERRVRCITTDYVAGIIEKFAQDLRAKIKLM